MAAAPKISMVRRGLILAPIGMSAVVCGYNIVWGAVLRRTMRTLGAAGVRQYTVVASTLFPTTTNAGEPVATIELPAKRDWMESRGDAVPRPSEEAWSSC